MVGWCGSIRFVLLFNLEIQKHRVSASRSIGVSQIVFRKISVLTNIV